MADRQVKLIRVNAGVDVEESDALKQIAECEKKLWILRAHGDIVFKGMPMLWFLYIEPEKEEFTESNKPLSQWVRAHIPLPDADGGYPVPDDVADLFRAWDKDRFTPKEGEKIDYRQLWEDLPPIQQTMLQRGLRPDQLDESDTRKFNSKIRLETVTDANGKLLSIDVMPSTGESPVDATFIEERTEFTEVDLKRIAATLRPGHSSHNQPPAPPEPKPSANPPSSISFGTGLGKDNPTMDKKYDR